MQRVKQNLPLISQKSLEYKSLDRLIEGINNALQPGKEDLLGRMMSDLAEDQKKQFGDNSSGQRTDVV
jgi:hypothetical protein